MKEGLIKGILTGLLTLILGLVFVFIYPILTLDSLLCFAAGNAVGVFIVDTVRNLKN